MKQYLDLLRHVRTHGQFKPDRTGTGTYSVFGAQTRFDLKQGFPLLTTKRIFTRGVILELIWMLRGMTNVRWLSDQNVNIWNEWADPVTGDLGRVYGAQWRSWRTADGRIIDQLQQVIERIKTKPDCRRLIVTAWNPGEIEDMKLPPCHCFFQFYVVDGTLSCQLYQRSADIFLGVPFNIASYALLTHMVAKVCGLQVGEFVHTFGDLHLYANHVQQADEQLQREPRDLPTLMLRDRRDITEFELEDVAFDGYIPHPSIQAPVAV